MSPPNPEHEIAASMEALEDVQRLQAFLIETWPEIGGEILPKLFHADYIVFTLKDAEVMMESLKACALLVDLHVKTDTVSGGICRDCGHPWPCRTIEILEEHAPA